ncbi:hypothetical protein E4T52_09433 [Aureobasidium sp. EXF-3400]|nr:hypothetical protein E4T52_09433 [Aureobasidium sp. EXF-3400]
MRYSRRYGRPARVFNMKYTYDISQWDMYHDCYVMIFCDLDAEAFEQHSAMARWWLTQHFAPMLYMSPARRSRRLNFNMFLGDSFMHPGALKYVLCAINRAKGGKKMFLELPKDFTLSVQVHQVLIFLQVEECIDPMHGHIRQIIRERPLTPVEFDVLWSCLGYFAPKIHEFALSMWYEHQKHQWSLAPAISYSRPCGEMMRYNAEEAVSSKEEPRIDTDTEGDAKMISEDIHTCPDDIGYIAEDEDSEQEDQGLTTTIHQSPTIIHQPSPIIYSRRRSLPTPYSELMFDIDTSDFRECADEEPEY